MQKYETNIRVRYQQTDQMGFVYHANYLVWFEIGRTEFMRSIGLPYIEFEKSKLYLPVLKVYCEYKHAIGYDDLLTVSTSLESLQYVRLVFNYEIRREKKIMAGGYTEHAFINEEGRPVVLKKTNPFLWNRLCRVLENDEK